MKYYPAFVAQRLKKKVISQIGKRVLDGAESGEKSQGCADQSVAGRLRPALQMVESVGGKGGVESVGIAVGTIDSDLVRTGC
jgi:hypothetical protein